MHGEQGRGGILKGIHRGTGQSLQVDFEKQGRRHRSDARLDVNQANQGRVRVAM